MYVSFKCLYMYTCVCMYVCVCVCVCKYMVSSVYIVRRSFDSRYVYQSARVLYVYESVSIERVGSSDLIGDISDISHRVFYRYLSLL